MKRKLQRKRGARRALLKNLVTSLILYERIKTTTEKAKEIRSLVERLIQRGKKNDLTSFRYLLKFLPKNAAKKVIEDLAPAYKSRISGFIRIIKLGQRKGDAANQAIIEFIERSAEDKNKHRDTESHSNEIPEEKNKHQKHQKEKKKDEKKNRKEQSKS